VDIISHYTHRETPVTALLCQETGPVCHTQLRLELDYSENNVLNTTME